MKVCLFAIINNICNIDIDRSMAVVFTGIFMINLRSWLLHGKCMGIILVGCSIVLGDTENND